MELYLKYFIKIHVLPIDKVVYDKTTTKILFIYETLKNIEQIGRLQI